MTKAALAAVVTLASVVLGGYVGPAVLFVALVAPGALVARVLRRMAVGSVLVTLPLAIAVGLVSVFTRPGSTILFELGPFDATLEGADFAARVVVRLFVMASALALFGLTTPPQAFVIDLERRGVAPRLAYAVGAVVGAVPAMGERARGVRDAQRARGLDTEGSGRRRLGGVVPLVGPVLIGSVHEVEARSLALEARAFGRPGQRHLLWAPPDGAGERLARWLLLAGLVALVAASIADALPTLP